MEIFKSLFGFIKQPNNMLDTEKTSNMEPQINCILQILKEAEYSLESQKLPNDYTLTRFKVVGKSRMIDLIYNVQSQLVRTYLLNVKNGIPDYKDTNNCYTLEMLDILTETTSRNSDKYFGENRPDGVYTRTNDQILSDYHDILFENKSMILGEEWIPKTQIDQIKTKKMGYTSFAGWAPDGQLQRIEQELSFLKQLGFIKKYDDNDLPEYESGFKWEKLIIFENSNTSESVEVMVDYRGQSDFMKFGNKNNSPQWKPYNPEEIKLKYT
jgi:hypothetical protein